MTMIPKTVRELSDYLDTFEEGTRVYFENPSEGTFFSFYVEDEEVDTNVGTKRIIYFCQHEEVEAFNDFS